MKKIIPIFCLLISFAFSCSSDINIVKNGVMNFDKTTTLGKVLDNWQSLQSSKWEYFETKNGIKVVQFTCQHKINQYFSKLKNLLPKDFQDGDFKFLDLDSYIQKLQFTINQDNTFQLDNIQFKITWKDGIFW